MFESPKQDREFKVLVHQMKLPKMVGTLSKMAGILQYGRDSQRLEGISHQDGRDSPRWQGLPKMVGAPQDSRDSPR